MIREIISSASTVLQLTMLFMLITLAIGLRGAGGGGRSPKVSVFLLSQTLISTPAQNALGRMFLASCVSLGIVRNSLLGYLCFLVDKFRVIYGTRQDQLIYIIYITRLKIMLQVGKLFIIKICR